MESNSSLMMEDELKSDGHDFLEHHGIKGQKWGVRRFQNSDGSLTDEGKRRYGIKSTLGSVKKAAGKALRKATGRQTDEELNSELAKQRSKAERRAKKEELKDLKYRASGRKKKLSEMNETELDDYINRLSKEKRIKDLEREQREASKSPVSKFIDGMVDTSISSVTRGVGRGLEESISRSMAAKSAQKTQHQLELKDRKWNVKNQDKYLTEDQKISREAARAEAKRNTARDEVERKAYRNDSSAQDLMAKAKNNWKSQDKNDEYEFAKKTADYAQNKARAAKSSLEYAAYSNDPEVAKDAQTRLYNTARAVKGAKNPSENSEQASNSNTKSNAAKYGKPDLSRKALPEAKKEKKKKKVKHFDFLDSVKDTYIGAVQDIRRTEFVSSMSTETIDSMRK